MPADGSQRVSMRDWPGRAPREPLPQAVVLPGRAAKDPRLWASVGTGILTALLALTYWFGTPRPARGPYAQDQHLETVIAVRPYLLPSVSWLVLGVTLMGLCVTLAVASSWVVARVWSVHAARRPGLAQPGRIVRLLPGLGVGMAVSAVVGAALLLTWLTTGPQVSEVSCPERPEGSCVRLAWGWTDLDTIVFDRRGLTMVPVRLGGSQ
ncbi:hypothetical protein D4740_01545 [Actinomyces sp. 2119]|nr:hypothetical protein D4740_01545 [Actinomyces sp. 2119]